MSPYKCIYCIIEYENLLNLVNHIVRDHPNKQLKHLEKDTNGKYIYADFGLSCQDVAKRIAKGQTMAIDSMGRLIFKKNRDAPPKNDFIHFNAETEKFMAGVFSHLQEYGRADDFLSILKHMTEGW